MKSISLPSRCHARAMNEDQRKELSLKALRQKSTITTFAKENKVRRKFVSKQQDKALRAVNETFAAPTQGNRI